MSTEEPRYVDPAKISDPNAEPLTDEEVDIQMLDSFRTGRQFIKSAADPITENFVLSFLKTIPFCKDCTELTVKAVEKLKMLDRPPCGICWHLYKEPRKFTNNDGKEEICYGWVKLRGQHVTVGLAENEIRTLMQDHDTYTKTEIMPKGVFWPITTAIVKDEELMENMYNEDVNNQADIQQKMIEHERKREEVLVKMQEESAPGSLEDYIKQKVRLCTAELKIKKAKEMIEQFTPILEEVSVTVEKLEEENENYYDDGLVLYQEKMEEIGYPKPESYYANIMPGV
jgi:hypothetical protein